MAEQLHDQSTYGEGDETRTLVLLRALQETETDVRVLGIGLRNALDQLPLTPELAFLADIADKAASRITPYVDALTNEYLSIRQHHSANYH